MCRSKRLHFFEKQGNVNRIVNSSKTALELRLKTALLCYLGVQWILAHTPHPPPHPETTWLLYAETFEPHANVWSYHYSCRPVNNWMRRKSNVKETRGQNSSKYCNNEWELINLYNCQIAGYFWVTKRRCQYEHLSILGRMQGRETPGRPQISNWFYHPHPGVFDCRFFEKQVLEIEIT